jgi:hypothetical protein
MKFYLLLRGECCQHHVLYIFDSIAERDAKTIECIFGDVTMSSRESDCWCKYQDELNESGSLEFEGDPGLEWFTAIPAKQ